MVLGTSNSFDILEAITEPVNLPRPVEGSHRLTPYEAQYQMVLYEKDKAEKAAAEKANNTSPVQTINEDATVLGESHVPITRMVSSNAPRRHKPVRGQEVRGNLEDGVRHANQTVEEDKNIQTGADNVKTATLKLKGKGVCMERVVCMVPAKEMADGRYSSHEIGPPHSGINHDEVIHLHQEITPSEEISLLSCGPTHEAAVTTVSHV